VSRFVAPNERVELAAVDLFAELGRPVATGLKAGGAVSVEPEPARAVFTGTPILLFGEASEKDAVLELNWDSESSRCRCRRAMYPWERSFVCCRVPA
jgi:hypothetical protein